MSTINSLKLVAAKKPINLPAVVQRRNKVLAKLWEQIKLAEAQASGTHYAPTKYRRLKDSEGNVRTVEMPKRIKPWWFISESGNTCLALHYGSKIVEISKGKTAIELLNKAELVSTLNMLKTAIEAGELDEAINNTANKLNAGFKK